ncbi:lysozyme inhibitor LprI family protein [Massilia sp. 2TAF26]|uniref:lysozyme inhibitor LprI family protein n=1 Tax=Massilia sp. 2TAF26 TaxID=3233012 RepID=UPI003F962CFB
MSTREINECAAIEQKAVEAKLNQAYQRTLKALDDEGNESIETKKKLIVAQRAWVKFREADCDAVYQRNAGGTIRTVMYIGCMQTHAKERIKALEDFSPAY